MPGPRGETCEGCRFWAADDDGRGLGECRRRAPRAAVAALLTDPDLQHHANDVWWPITVDTEWCGEWEARPAGG